MCAISPQEWDGVARTFRVGEWLVTPELNALERAGETVRLEPKIMLVLLTLAEHPGQVASREQIFEKVWPGVHVSDEVLTRSIFELRKVFGDNSREPAYIQTIPKGGYRLLAPVVKEEAPPAKKGKLTTAGAIAAILALSSALFFYILHKQSSDVIHTLAVLPFVNANADPTLDYLSDGLTEGLIDSLSQIPTLQVRPRSSSFHFKGSSAELPAIARELNVEAVVTGRIVQKGDSLIVSAELVDVGNNRNLWGESYERKFKSGHGHQYQRTPWNKADGSAEREGQKGGNRKPRRISGICERPVLLGKENTRWT